MNLKDIEKLANLSRIDLPESEKKSLLKEMDSILAYVDQVKSATASAHSPAGDDKNQPHNIFRDDGEPHASGAFTEVLLKAAPSRHGDFIKVKKIL